MDTSWIAPTINGGVKDGLLEVDGQGGIRLAPQTVESISLDGREMSAPFRDLLGLFVTSPQFAAEVWTHEHSDDDADDEAGEEPPGAYL